jgi:hypothetical protein
MVLIFCISLFLVEVKLVYKNSSEDGRFWPKHVKDDWLKNVNIINHSGRWNYTSYVITSVTDQNEQS